MIFFAIGCGLALCGIVLARLGIRLAFADPTLYGRNRALSGSFRQALTGRIPGGGPMVRRGLAWDDARRCFVETRGLSDDAIDDVLYPRRGDA